MKDYTIWTNCFRFLHLLCYTLYIICHCSLSWKPLDFMSISLLNSFSNMLWVSSMSRSCSKLHFALVLLPRARSWESFSNAVCLVRGTDIFFDLLDCLKLKERGVRNCTVMFAYYFFFVLYRNLTALSSSIST